MKNLLIIALCLISLIAQAKQNQDMFYLLAKFEVKEASIKTFKEASLASVTASRKEPGNIEMKMYADDTKNNVFYVYSRWESEAAYELHKSFPHSVNIAKVAKATLIAPPTIMPLGATAPNPLHGLKQINEDDAPESLFFIFKIKEGYRDEVIKRFETHVKHSREEKGNLLFDFYTIDGEENTFVVYENWRNKSALFDIHLKQDYSEVTGALLADAMIGEMGDYMSFVTEINPVSDYYIEKKWQIGGLSQPESVLSIPGHKWIYVSNVNGEEQGFISRLSKDGEINQLKWSEGMKSPCGMGYWDGNIYVADQTQVHQIDIESGEIVNTFPSKATMLNDLSISYNGQVFISALTQGQIYTIKNNEVVLWIEAEEFTTPNGLVVQGDQLITGTIGSELSRSLKAEQYGSIYSIDLHNKSVKLIDPSHKLGTFDGIVEFDGGLLATSPMTGKLFFIKDGKSKLLMDKAHGIADIGIDAQENILYIPHLFGNILEAYQLKGVANNIK